MIGSNTLIVKENGIFRVYVFGGFPPRSTELNVEKFKEFIKKFKKPDADGLTEKDAYVILDSHQCNSPFEPHYSPFVGDGIVLLDLDKNEFVDRKQFVKDWQTSHVDEIEEMEKDLRNQAAFKRQLILEEYKRLEQNVLLLMRTKKNDPKDLDRRSYSGPHAEYRDDTKEIHFFIGDDNTNQIKGMKSFGYWFVERRQNLKSLLKRLDWTGRPPRTVIYTFTYRNKKWVFDVSCGNCNEISEFIK